MPVAFTSTPVEARWLSQRLRALNPPLPVFLDSGRGTARHIVYRRQGGTDVVNLAGTYLVRSAWVVYVSQPITSGTINATYYVQDLQADADRMHEAIYKPSEPEAITGRYIEECRRDEEHYLPVYDGNTLTEIQLGGLYVLYTSLA